MYSRESNSMLHDHIIDGFHSTHEGLHRLREDKLISKDEYTSLLEQNIKRLVARIQEFRIKEGLMEVSRRFTAVIFACLFAYMQINGDDLEMRRTSRTRSARSARSQRNGRRRNEDIGSNNLLLPNE